jgi:hypothetical protein
MSYATEHNSIQVPVLTEHIHLLQILQIMYNKCEKIVIIVNESTKESILTGIKNLYLRIRLGLRLHLLCTTYGKEELNICY